MIPKLEQQVTQGAEVTSLGRGSWRLSTPAGKREAYRLAQLDDYAKTPRGQFKWSPTLSLSLSARVCPVNAAGTWGVGLWNDPFSLSTGLQGTSRRFPALPNAAWFFYASAPNYLSLRDDLPAQGLLAATFRSPHLPAPLLAMALPGLALALLPPAARLLRRLGSRLVQQDAASLDAHLEPVRHGPSGAGAPGSAGKDSRPPAASSWHSFTLVWTTSQAAFHINGETALETPVSPKGPLGLVLWVDNQYAAWPPRARPKFGTLPNPEPTWLEIADLEIG